MHMLLNSSLKCEDVIIFCLLRTSSVLHSYTYFLSLQLHFSFFLIFPPPPLPPPPLPFQLLHPCTEIERVEPDLVSQNMDHWLFRSRVLGLDTGVPREQKVLVRFSPWAALGAVGAWSQTQGQRRRCWDIANVAAQNGICTIGWVDTSNGIIMCMDGPECQKCTCADWDKPKLLP